MGAGLVAFRFFILLFSVPLIDLPLCPAFLMLVFTPSRNYMSYYGTERVVFLVRVELLSTWWLLFIADHPLSIKELFHRTNCRIREWNWRNRQMNWFRKEPRYNPGKLNLYYFRTCMFNYLPPCRFWSLFFLMTRQLNYVEVLFLATFHKLVLYSCYKNLSSLY
jgi:hypothetical protein